jgi:hypothetical protein
MQLVVIDGGDASASAALRARELPADVDVTVQVWIAAPNGGQP